MPDDARNRHRAALALAATLTAAGASAQVQPPLSGVLTLTTTASVEVTKDVLSVVFSSTRDGADAQAVQSALKQALDAALAEAKKIAKPGQVEVQTGNFSLYPRYGNPRNGQPTITGWQGTAELMVQGKDTTSIAQLTGRVGTMAIARVGYTLSKEAREKVEAEVTAQAIATWRARAQQMTQQFGYGGYTVREVAVRTNQDNPLVPQAIYAKRGVADAAQEALPTEAGKAEVTVAIEGSAQMTR